jgi:hypothetical protein
LINTLREFLTGSFLSRKGHPAFENKQERELFDKRLIETASWCAERLIFADPKQSLRSNLLKPLLVADDAWNYEINDPQLELAALCEKRAAAMNQSVKNVSHSGRLLLFWPHETLTDGAAAVTSRGYFDDWNMPPWDTWFWYGNLVDEPAALVSWVPEEFVNLVEEGVSVNPEECLRLLRSS